MITEQTMDVSFIKQRIAELEDELHVHKQSMHRNMQAVRKMWYDKQNNKWWNKLTNRQQKDYLLFDSLDEQYKDTLVKFVENLKMFYGEAIFHEYQKDVECVLLLTAKLDHWKDVLFLMSGRGGVEHD